MNALKVLVVDDSATGRTYVSRAVELSGVAAAGIRVAGNGLEALSDIERGGVDAVFLDLNMPVMNGFELVDKLSASGMISKIVVVVTSSEGNQARIEALKSKGVKFFMRKPFSAEQLKTVIDEIMISRSG